MQSKLRRKKLNRTNQGSNFLGGNFSNRDLEEKVNPSNSKDYFSSRTDPSIFTSIATVLLDRSKHFSVEINKPLPAPVHSVS